MQATNPAAPAATHDPDQRVYFHGVSWEDFERLLAIRGERSGVRITYSAGEVELMSPSRSHERINAMLRRLVEAYADGRGLDLCAYGSWTLKARTDERGLDPDACYVLGNHEPERPDLAIEVVWCSGGFDKLEVYRGLGIGEVWSWRAGRISVHLLEEGGYVEQARSRLLPGLDLELVAALAPRTDHQSQAVRELRAQIRKDASPER